MPDHFSDLDYQQKTLPHEKIKCFIKRHFSGANLYESNAAFIPRDWDCSVPPCSGYSGSLILQIYASQLYQLLSFSTQLENTI